MTLDELSAYARLQKQLAESKELLTSLMAASGPKAQAVTGMPHTARTRDRISDLVVEISGVQEDIERIAAESSKAEQRISSYIETIPDTVTRTVFRLRFLHCMTWREVAALIGGRNTEKSVKNICYRYIKKLGRRGAR